MTTINSEKQKYKVLRNKKIVDNYKQNHPCACGENRIACLDFHHSDGSKENNISFLVCKHKSIKLLLEEMDKCIVICSNCHRVLHAR